MTKAQAAELQAMWKLHDPPRLCAHIEVDMERNEDGYVTGSSYCLTCGEAIAHQSLQD